MADNKKNELSMIPLPTEKENRGDLPVSHHYSGGFSDLRNLLHKIQLDDIILFGLILLIATDDNCDNFLLVLLVFIFIAGLDKQLFPFL